MPSSVSLVAPNCYVVHGFWAQTGYITNAQCRILFKCTFFPSKMTCMHNDFMTYNAKWSYRAIGESRLVSQKPKAYTNAWM